MLLSVVWLCSIPICCINGICGVDPEYLSLFLPLPPYTGRKQEILLLILKRDAYIVAMANNHSINCHKAFIQKVRAREPNDPPAERGIVLKILVMLCLSKICIKQPFLSFVPLWKKILPNVWLVLSCFFVIKMTHGSFKWEQTAERKKQTVCFRWMGMESVAVPFSKASLRYPKPCDDLGSSNHRAGVMNPNIMKPNHFPGIRGPSCFFRTAFEEHLPSSSISTCMSSSVFQRDVCHSLSNKGSFARLPITPRETGCFAKNISHKVLWNFPCCCKDTKSQLALVSRLTIFSPSWRERRPALD